MAAGVLTALYNSQPPKALAGNKEGEKTFPVSVRRQLSKEAGSTKDGRRRAFHSAIVLRAAATWCAEGIVRRRRAAHSGGGASLQGRQYFQKLVAGSTRAQWSSRSLLFAAGTQAPVHGVAAKQMVRRQINSCRDAHHISPSYISADGWRSERARPSPARRRLCCSRRTTLSPRC